MNAPVMDLCNVVLHDGDNRRKSWAHAQQLVCGSDEVAAARLELEAGVDEPAWVARVLHEPVVFVDVVPSPTQSARNAAEADVVATLVAALEKRGVPLTDMAVLTPFRAQLRQLGRILPAPVELSTVDRFQGKDAPCVIVSFARADASTGLLADARRLNVALSRARRKLILVGARAALAAASPLFARLAAAVPVVEAGEAPSPP
jgi:superfamily I DNA and/or RNA helicase